jgi:hypothetical protein
MRPLLTTSGLLFVGLFTTLAHASDLEARAARVAQLRAEVETLNTDVGLAKEELTADLRATAGQEAELEAAVRRQELRLERLLGDEQSAIREVEKQTEGSGEDLAAVVQDGIEHFHAQVSGGLPFKVEDRLRALSELEAHLNRKSLPTEQIAARLWAFAEDERRLTRENAIGRQVAPFNGGEVLVDVARLGMVAMYFRAPDGRTGQVIRSGDDWLWEPLSDDADIAQVSALFDALGKGIRTGWFELPSPLAAIGGAQ